MKTFFLATIAALALVVTSPASAQLELYDLPVSEQFEFSDPLDFEKHPGSSKVAPGCLAHSCDAHGSSTCDGNAVTYRKITDPTKTCTQTCFSGSTGGSGNACAAVIAGFPTY